MKQENKVALVRLMTELVKSDTKICAGELDLFDEICTKYSINKSVVLSEAQKITLADAVNTLTDEADGLSKKDLERVIGELKRFVGDNCEALEALLFVTLQRSLKCEGIVDCSFDVPDSIDAFTVFYVENEFDDDINNEIIVNYREIENEFKLAGFEFVYIPRRAESFSKMNKSTLQEIIGHLAPMMVANNKDRLRVVYDGICNLNTSDFCRTLLCVKLGLKSLYDTEPSFLVKIGDSKVMYKPVHNYYKFMIRGNVLDEVRGFVDDYKQLVKGVSLNLSGNIMECNAFEYRGFNKAIFDLLAFPGKTCESDVLVNTIARKIKFENIGCELDVYAYERALYVFLLYANVMGITVRVNETSERKRERNNRIFSKIYKLVGGYSSVEELVLAEKKSSISRIRKALKQLELLEKREELYCPNEEDGILSVRVDSNKVFVTECDKVVLMKDCATWKNLLKE